MRCRKCRFRRPPRLCGLYFRFEGQAQRRTITHRGLANTVYAVGRDLLLGPHDTVLAWSTIVFDVACLEICLPFAFGATLYIVEKELVSGGGARIEQLRRSAATVMFGTPTMYRLCSRRMARRCEHAARCRW